MLEINPEQLRIIENKIAFLEKQLEEAKLVVKKWSDTSARLSQSAAEARAKNQGAGRGLGGALLGPKFRKMMRSSAASSNAAIAQDVAKKRAKIAEGKREAQDLVSRIQTELTATKEEYKSLIDLVKSQNKAKATKTKVTTDSVDLLKKLKEAHDLGLLTDQEYEEKRKKIVSNI